MMPVSAQMEEDDSGLAAFDTVCESLNSPSFEAAVNARESDLRFLSELMNSTIVQSLIETHDVLDDAAFEPVSVDNVETVQDALNDLVMEASHNSQARELQRILSNPHMQALIHAHDDVAAKNYEEDFEVSENFIPAQQMFPAANTPSQDAIRMVGIRKNEEESLGITVRVDDNGELVISRIMTGGTVDTQGLLHVGDIIKEINGQEVNDPVTLMDIMKRTSGSVTLKILPSYFDQNTFSKVFMRTHFAYNPHKDTLIPCREAGLEFKEGDILQVVNMEDPNWWQATKVDEHGESGLVPSQQLEEKRRAFVRPEFDYTHKSLLCGLMTKKKRKMMYQAKSNPEFDRNDLLIYEEVSRMPPFQRKTLVLIGAQGVGRRTLKQRLIKADSSRFGAAIPHTSRTKRDTEKDGDVYRFVPREDMDEDIERNKYLEYGEFDGNIYGTKIDTIRRVVRSGRMCILDLNPQALKAIKTSEFMPYVVFIATPPIEIMRNMHEYARQKGRTDRVRTERDFRNSLDESAEMERHYKGFFDLKIVNDNMDVTYNTLRKAIETLSTEPQWVPISWVY